MQFGLSSEQTLLIDSVDSFLRDQAPLDRVRRFADGREARADDVVAGLAALGVPGLLVPEQHGGVGLQPLEACLVAEVLGRRVAPVAFCASAAMVPTALLAAGSPAQQAEWLPRIADGRATIGAAVSELAGARATGSPTGETAAVHCRDGRLTGRALFVIDFEADAYLVADSQGGLHLVAADAAGLQRVRLPTVDRSRHIGELQFTAVAADRLPGANPAVLRQVLAIGRAVLAADTLGAGQSMLDQAVAYAGQRQQFGRVIASFQAVKHLCAEMAATLEPTRAFVWYAGHALGQGAADADLAVCLLKAHIGEVGRDLAKTATEVHGGMGFTDLLGLHYWFKRIGLNRQLLGTPERLRLEAARLQGLAA